MASERKRGRKLLTPVRPNAGIANEYAARLQKEVDDMAASLHWWIRSEFRKVEPRLAADASPTSDLKKAVRELSRQWQKRFDSLSVWLATRMVQKSGANVDAMLKKKLRDAGFTVRFRPTPAQMNVLQASIAENVSLIRSIPAQYMTQVEGHVMRSVTQGFRMDRLMHDLQKQFGVTKRRAATITHDQTRKATAAFQRTRQLELGITEGVWIHSGGGKEPRASHKAFSGKSFDIREGVDFNDGFGHVLPGEAINCRCVWKMVL